MNLKEQIKNYMNTMAQNEPSSVTLSQLSEAIGAWESDIKTTLEKMISDGSIIAEKKRPIRYHLSEPIAASHMNLLSSLSNTPFTSLIGLNGSLYVPIETAKAAVMYPPFGIHLLITGNSGVGKSRLAKEIWKYKCEIHKNMSRPQPPFVVFNCAEYSENPQLLLAELFGYVKGAFTGADSNHEGLVSKANDGILFLDEIHRLPASGQEMFFTLLDHGTYRPLGSSENRSSNIMLIGATTETPESFLLTTFKRRIPLMITIPSLNERPLEERIDLIRLFLSEESAILKMPIKINCPALCLLLCYESQANIGSLKNEIRVSCAYAFLRKSKECSVLVITQHALSRMLNSNIVVEDIKILQKTLDLKGFSDGLSVCPDINTFSLATQAHPDSFNLYQFIEEKYKIYEDESQNPIDLQNKIINDLKIQYTTLMNSYYGTYPDLNSEIPKKYKQLADNIILIAQEKLGYTFTSGFSYILAHFIWQVLQLSQSNRSVAHFMPQFYERPSQSDEFFSHAVQNLLQSELQSTLTISEIGLLFRMIHNHQIKNLPSNNIDVIAVSVGNAVSIMNFTNNALKKKFMVAIDVPPESDAQEISNAIMQQVNSYKISGPFIILIDSMIHTPNVENFLKEKATQPFRIIPFLTPSVALQLYNIIHSSSKDIKDISCELIKWFQNDISIHISML